MKLTGPSLSEIPRHELIAAALELGIDRPEQLSPEQLREKIRAASAGVAKEAAQQGQHGLGRVSLFSVARNLIASVVERGLNLPDAARVIRDTVRPSPRHRPPLPTVTLAQIYLAQGYADRAIVTLGQVLEREPNNYTAVELYQRLTRSGDGAAPPSADGVSARSAEHLSIAPGIAPASELWYTPSVPLTRGVRDGLVLVQREPRQVTVYWELSGRQAASLNTANLNTPNGNTPNGNTPGLLTGACEVRVECYSGSAQASDANHSSDVNQPREINLPVHAPFGWAVVELLDDEVPCACLRVEGRVAAVAQRVSISADSAAPALEFGARPRAFWNDLVGRALS